MTNAQNIEIDDQYRDGKNVALNRSMDLQKKKKKNE
jgi:hypothetical protein